MFIKKFHNYLLTRIMLIVFLTTIIIPTLPFIFEGHGDRRVVAEEVYTVTDVVYNDLAVKAIRNNYSLHQSGQAIDGGWGNFSSYDAYILNQAGADLASWEYNGTSFKESVIGLIDATIASEGTEGQSSAKRVAQEYLAAKALGEGEKATQLLNILQTRQLASGNGSFDNNAFSDLAAFEALGRAGNIGQIDTGAAIDYILSNQDATGAWTKSWNDFMATAQAIRALTFLEPYAGEQAGAVNTAINNGLVWMQALQKNDGSFQDAGGWDDPLVDTAEVIFTLDLLGTDPATWVSGEGNSPVDYLVNDALNEDGTFGANKNVMDNSWALDAYLKLGGSIAEGTVLRITATPVTAEIMVGDTQQFTAEVYKLGGTTQDVTDAANWVVAEEGIATISATGLVTGVGAGDTVVTATYQGVSGSASMRIAGGGSGPQEQPGTEVSIRVIGKNKETLFSGTVTLKESDQWGINALGALHKTGLSYSYDSISYIHTIAGQGPQGMNGWMYKVNGRIPNIPAVEYNLQSGDNVEWFYSTDLTNMIGSGGGSSLSTKLTQDPIKTGDEIVLNTPSTQKEVVIGVENREDKKVSFTPSTIKGLADGNKKLTIENEGVKVGFTPQSLLTEELTGVLNDEKAKLEIGVQELTLAMKEELLEQAKVGQRTGLFDVGGKIFDFTAQVSHISTDGSTSSEKIDSFNEPVAITIDLSDITLSKEDITKLTGIRYEKDEQGTINPVKLGGTYNPETKTFTFYTDKFSLYGVLKVKDLVKITLQVNKMNTKVNGEEGWTDVPPTIINNRTMVPVRLIAETLGADVNWIDETRTVEIILKGKKLSLVIGENLPEMDTSATIVNNRTLVPLRYVSENLGANVMWFPSTRKIEIVK